MTYGGSAAALTLTTFNDSVWSGFFFSASFVSHKELVVIYKATTTSYSYKQTNHVPIVKKLIV